MLCTWATSIFELWCGNNDCNEFCLAWVGVHVAKFSVFTCSLCLHRHMLTNAGELN
jgi:hypothetical protein